MELSPIAWRPQTPELADLCPPPRCHPNTDRRSDSAGTFLIRLGNADRKELERASSAVRSDQEAWEAAGGRVAQIVASLGLGEQKAQLCQQARTIVQGNAAQIQGEDRKFASWAAQGVIVAVLAGGSAKRPDLRVLCKPFARLLRETPIPAPGENAYCQAHPGVPLTYGGCHVCRRGDDERYRRW